MENIRREIIEGIRSFDNIPVLDAIVAEVERTVYDQKAGAGAVAAVIERDLGLSAKILKAVNSVYYAGRYGQIGDLGQAVARLGVDQTFRLCLMFKTMEMFSKSSNHINLRDFWCHSIATAQVTRVIARASDKALFDTRNAYAAGLFHDIGVFVLDRFFPDICRTIQTRMSETFDARHETELKLFNIDHSEIGGLLLERWKFPEDVVRAVAFHHNPGAAPAEFASLTQLVHLSDFACASVERAGPKAVLPNLPFDSVWNSLNIREDTVGALLNETKNELERAGQFLALEL